MNIKDIARLSGVGISTVSRVINNNPDVKDSTREKVMKVIREYNYVPNNSARMLKKNQTSYIGILVQGVFNPFFSEMIKVIEENIEKNGYTMVVRYGEVISDDLDSLISFIKEKKLKGLIYLGGNFAQIPKEKFSMLPCKTVILCGNLGKNSDNKHFSSVGINDYRASQVEMKYILDKGHRKICVLIGDRADNGVGQQRLKGYLKALSEYGIYENQIDIIEGNYNYKEAYEQTHLCLRRNNQITAIVSLSDTMAVGAMRAVIEVRNSRLSKIDVIGFDGMDIAKYYHPSITTISQPREDIALKGITKMMCLLNGVNDNSHCILETKLTKGESC